MSILKNVSVEALATHPGFLKLKLNNDDGTLACETMLSVGITRKLIRDLEDGADIATKLLSSLQSIITKEALDGKFGDGMRDWANKGGYEQNARQAKEQVNG